MSSSHYSLLRSAVVGGSLAAMVIFIGTYLLGTVTSYEGIENLREIRPTLRFTASGMMTSTATILALMLTLLSFSQQTAHRLKAFHYDRIGWIARFAAIIFISALVLLMVLNVPINNAEETFAGFYDIIYYVLLTYTALMGGCMITIILLLYQAARDIILIAHPDRRVTGLYAEEDEDPDRMTKRERERMVTEEENGESATP